MEYLKRDYLLKPKHIVDICNVSLRTAQRWISGETQIPKPMKRLLELELSGKIIPDSWPDHWHFNHRDFIETETCHPALSWQQLTWYSYAIQGWQESLRVVPEIQASIDYLMNKLPRADVIKLEEYRDKLRELQRIAEMSPKEAVELARGILAENDELEPPVTHRKFGC